MTLADAISTSISTDSITRFETSDDICDILAELFCMGCTDVDDDGDTVWALMPTEKAGDHIMTYAITRQCCLRVRVEINPELTDAGDPSDSDMDGPFSVPSIEALRAAITDEGDLSSNGEYRRVRARAIAWAAYGEEI